MYDELLVALLESESKTLVLADATITASAIRQGLTQAFTRHNQFMDLCELPRTEGRISVAESTESHKIKVTLKPPSTGGFAGKFTIL